MTEAISGEKELVGALVNSSDIHGLLEIEGTQILSVITYVAAISTSPEGLEEIKRLPTTNCVEISKDIPGVD